MAELTEEEKKAVEFRDLSLAYKEVFIGQPGKKVLQDLCNFGHLSDSIFDLSHAEMCRREGQRQVVLHVLGMLISDPEHVQRVIMRDESAFDFPYDD